MSFFSGGWFKWNRKVYTFAEKQCKLSNLANLADLGTIPASSGTAKSEGQQMIVLNIVLKNLCQKLAANTEKKSIFVQT